MKLKNLTVQIGGFHDHWMRNGTDNPTLLIAALEYYHYDFICLMDGTFTEAEWIKDTVEQWLPGRRVFIGKEDCYGFAHMVNLNTEYDHDFNSKDYISEFRKAKSGGGFSALAHICYPGTKETILADNALDRLIDENIVDAVQLEKIGDWQYVAHRAKEGKKLPLIGGWDSHYIKPKAGLMDTLYYADSNPDGHIDTAPGFRTIVFAENNDYDSIISAVRAGRSVLEYVATGELVGSEELVQALIENDYAGEMARFREGYSAIKLQESVLTAGTDRKLQFPGKGRIFYPDGGLRRIAGETDEDGAFLLKKVPMPVSQDESYLPIAWEGEKGGRTWAIRILNDINLSIYPMWSREKNCRVLSLHSEQDICGTVTITKPMAFTQRLEIKAGTPAEIILPQDLPVIFDYDLVFTTDAGTCRHYFNTEALVVADYFSGSWESCPEYAMDDARFCGGFGNNRPYPGKEEFSAVFRFAWDEENLYCRINVTDPIPTHPPFGHFIYNGDCVYFSVEPEISHNHPSKGSISISIGDPAESGPVAQVGRDTITDYLKEFTYYDGGRVMVCAVPWKDFDKIAAVKPQEGTHIAVGIGATNSNGAGLLDGMMWPKSCHDRMRTAADFAILCLKRSVQG